MVGEDDLTDDSGDESDWEDMSTSTKASSKMGDPRQRSKRPTGPRDGTFRSHGLLAESRVKAYIGKKEKVTLKLLADRYKFKSRKLRHPKFG